MILIIVNLIFFYQFDFFRGLFPNGQDAITAYPSQRMSTIPYIITGSFYEEGIADLFTGNLTDIESLPNKLSIPISLQLGQKECVYLWMITFLIKLNNIRLFSW